MSLRFALTEPLRTKLETAIATLTDAPSASSSTSSDDVLAFQSALREGSINLQDAKSLSAHLRAEAKAAAAKESDPEAATAILNQPLLFVHELLQGAAPVLPERAAKPPPHPSLAPRLEKLRAAQEDKEYAKLIGRNLRDETSAGRDTAEMATYRSQLGVGVNLLVSMATMFIVGAYAGGVEGEPFLCVRATICGLILMLLTMAVEMSLFLIGAIRVDDQVHKREQRAKKGLRDRTKLAQHQPPSSGPSGGGGGGGGGVRPLSVKAD